MDDQMRPKMNKNILIPGMKAKIMISDPVYPAQEITRQRAKSIL
jgi:hypothetical protein